MKKVFRTNKKGFSLTEVLVAMLILGLVTMVVAVGMPTAIDAYYKVVDGANAQVMLTTATTALRNELGTALNVTVSSNEISYRSSFNGGNSKISSGDAGIIVSDFLDSDNPKERLLVSREAGSKSMTAKYESASYSETAGVLTFSNIEITKGDHTLVALDKFIVNIGF